MTLDIRDALRSGYDDLRTPAGLQLVFLAFAVQLIANVVNDSTAASLAEDPSATAPVEPGSLVVALPPSVLAGLGVVSLVGSLVVTLVSLRTFAADETLSIPADAYRGRLLVPALQLLVGTIVLVVAVAIGLVALIVPGLFLLVSLIFFQVYVAVDDDGFLAGMRRSWGLATGNRVELFLLGLAVFAVSVGVGVVFGILGAALEPASRYLPGLAATVGTAIVSTFVLATLVAAYRQLTDGTGTDAETATTEIDTDWHR